MSEGARANGRHEVIRRLQPLTDAIARGDYADADRESQRAQVGQMITQGNYIFHKLSADEQRGVRHTNKSDATYLAAFLYKHSKFPLSTYAASVAAQRYLYPSTRRSGTRVADTRKNGWVED